MNPFDKAGRKAFWDKGLEGWNVLESQVVNEWLAEGERRGQRTLLRQKLTRVLETRFHTPVPEEIKQRIEAQSDVAVLDRWFDLALTVGSPDEFRQATASG
ncbi:MAG TPA: hypothetical protein VIL46_05625 [Gemmataceae bacterium]